MWPKDAYVGQHIVCINDDSDFTVKQRNLGVVGDMNGLTAGKIYTIREVGIDPTWHRYGIDVLCVWLKEIVRPVDKDDIKEVGFNIDRFRPVDETRLDIFREMLVNPPKVMENV